jgi:2,5-diamino-6-(ribosylamino)-4(3H)-pyrimidinone 5'-phosphate reductase
MVRPTVVAFNSASVDGRIAASADALLLHGDARWQAIETWAPAPPKAGPFSVARASYDPDATLEGSGSFVREADVPAPLPAFEGDPALLYNDYMPDEIVHRPGHRGWFVVLDGRGRVRDWIADGSVFGPEWAGWHLLVLVAEHTPAAYLAYLQRERIPYLVAGSEGTHVDLELALDKLHERLGIGCVLSTAGGRLNGALLRAGLIDEVNVEYLPAIIGGRTTPALYDAPALGRDDMPARLDLISCQVLSGGRIWARYRVHTSDAT